MSRFLCGKISFRQSPWDNGHGYLFDLIRTAADNELPLQFGWSIVQNEVREILGETGPHELPFFIPGSPITNVSEELIFPEPFVADEETGGLRYDDEEAWRILRANFSRVAILVAKMLASDSVTLVTVALSDGWDPHYPVVACSVDDFVDTVLAQFERPDFVPLVHVRVSKPFSTSL